MIKIKSGCHCFDFSETNSGFPRVRKSTFLCDQADLVSYIYDSILQRIG